MAHFPENEMKASGDENIYDNTFSYLDKEFERLLPRMIINYRRRINRDYAYYLELNGISMS